MIKHLGWYLCEKCQSISFRNSPEDITKGEEHEAQCDGNPPPLEEPTPTLAEQLEEWDAHLKAQGIK